MRILQPNFAHGGLNTKTDSTGLPVMEHVVLQDLRVVGTNLEQRPGIVRVGRLDNALKAADLTAASSHYFSCPVDARVWSLLKRSEEKVRLLCQ